MARGRYIVFEGADGSGKSTQCRMFVDYLHGMKLEVVHFREPGSTKVGEAVREILLSRKDLSMTALTELFLFETARTQLVEEVIRPSLENGLIVVSDRSGISSLVYQGFAGNVNPKKIVMLNELAYQGISPDRVYLLRTSLEVALARRGSRGAADRMESKGSDFQRKVNEGYGRVPEFYPDVKIIDANGAEESIHRGIVRDFEMCFPEIV